ncbi:MAG: hypothetical protein ACK4IK_03455 [Bacteroidia bacterium]
MIKRKIKLIAICLTVFLNNTYAQVSIISGFSFNAGVTPEQMLWVNINNMEKNGTAIINAEIKNMAGVRLIEVVSSPFSLSTGVNNFIGKSLPIQRVVYANNPQANFIKTTGMLPSGAYVYCVRLTHHSSSDVLDEYCEDFISSFNPYINLISPFDKDTIATKYPLLTWVHSEPFDLLSPNEFFKLKVCEIKKGQSAETAISTNVPVYFKNHLTSHFVQYPTDAIDLEDGKSYAWQVQRISQNNVITQTEVWSFVLKAEPDKDKDLKYVVLNKSVSNQRINVYEKLYFRYDEIYSGSSILCNIYNEKNELLKPELTKDSNEEISNNKNNKNDLNTKSIGYNAYEFDIRKYNLKPGYYKIEIINEKKEKYTVYINKQ